MKNRDRQRANRKLNNSLRCNRNNCTSNRYGTCCALENTNFGDKSCPFYKTKDQCTKEGRAVLEHLVATGRTDLIEKYYGEKKAHEQV